MNYSDLIRDFLDDAEGHLNIFENALLALEKSGCNRDILHNALGPLHTLKGNSGMMGLESVNKYVHLIEEVLNRVDEGRLELAGVIDSLFDCAHALRKVFLEIGKDPESLPDLTEKIIRLQKCLNGSPDRTETEKVDLSAYLGVKTDVIKVDFKRLDDMLNLVGELVIYRTRLHQIETRLKDAVREKALVKDLKEGLEFMGNAVSGLQESIMRARMLPAGHVFKKFPRMVRDISRLQGKEVRLVLEGEGTEMDKTVVDELEEPLLHLLRNALDHGIESPEKRRATGKDPEGTITMSAAHESNYVIVRVRDDGAGIDFEDVRKAAVGKGLIKPEENREKENILPLIFSAGFTTKQEVSDISGRGIGLDVVNRNISKLSGQITVDSIPGKGTTFTIKLPLSLAIIPALMAEAGGEVYAIPMSAVDESIKVKEEDVHVINNHEVIRFRDRVMPVVRLGEFFGLGRTQAKRFYIVILGRADKCLALAVDRLRGKQEIVIKPLDDTFGKSYGVAGASILGDGRIVLIIDVLSLWNGNRMKREQQAMDRREEG